MTSPLFRATSVAAQDVAAFVRKAARKQFDVDVVAKERVDEGIINNVQVFINNITSETNNGRGLAILR